MKDRGKQNQIGGLTATLHPLWRYRTTGSKLKKSMQKMLRLLQLNLLEKRDLMALLRGDPLRNKQVNISQLALL